MQHKTQKITAHIPSDLLKKAQSVTGAGITDTIKTALERLAMDKHYDALMTLRGKHTFSLDLDELRKDRGEE